MKTKVFMLLVYGILLKTGQGKRYQCGACTCFGKRDLVDRAFCVNKQDKPANFFLPLPFSNGVISLVVKGNWIFYPHYMPMLRSIFLTGSNLPCALFKPNVDCTKVEFTSQPPTLKTKPTFPAKKHPKLETQPVKTPIVVTTDPGLITSAFTQDFTKEDMTFLSLLVNISTQQPATVKPQPMTPTKTVSDLLLIILLPYFTFILGTLLGRPVMR